MDKYYTAVNQNEINFFKFDTFEYYCKFFLLKKKKRPKNKKDGATKEDRTAFYFDQNNKLDALLDKYFARMNSPPNFSDFNEMYSKIYEETERYIKENENLIRNTSKDVIYCIKKIIRIKEKVDFFNTHFFSNTINIVVFIRSQLNQFYESKPNIIVNPNLNYSNSQKSNDLDQTGVNVNIKNPDKAENDNKIDYSYDKADFDIECPVEILESYFENEFQKSPLIKKAPSKIISLCTYIRRHLAGRFQQLSTEDISQTINAMSCIYDSDLLYIIPNIVDDFIASYIRDASPDDFEELRNISVQIMAGNFYNTLHHIGPMRRVTITPSTNSIISVNPPDNENDNNKDDNQNSKTPKNDKNDDDEESTSNTSSVESLSYSVEDQAEKHNQTENKSLNGSNSQSNNLTDKIASKRAIQDQNYNKISFAPLRKFISKYCKLFHISYYQPIDDELKSKKKKDKNAPHVNKFLPTNERMVIRCSFIRLLCNIIYTNFPGFLYEPINNKFFESCEIVRFSTPKAMEINPKIILEYMQTTSFVFLVESQDLYTNNSNPDQNSPVKKKKKRSKTFSTSNDKDVCKKTENELKKASNLINETQFLTNPIDITNNIFCALNHINDFFQKCAIVKKYGSLNWNTSTDDTGKEVKMQMNTNFLAFDDIFPLFCMVISYTAPSNAVAVSDFLRRTEDLKFGSQFDFAKLMFTSAIEYITNDVLNDIKKTENK